MNMKKIMPAACCAILISLAACSSAPTETPKNGKAVSLKGYSLYGWQADNEWYYAVIDVVEEQASLRQIALSPGVVRGADGLKSRISVLPKGSTLFWNATKMAMPPESDVRAIEKACDENEIDLRKW